MVYRILYYFVYIFCKIFFRLTIEGKSKIPREGAFILASNHVSNIDPIIIGVAAGRRLYFLAKEELFRNKLASLLLKSLGAIPVRRDKVDRRALNKALAVIKNRLPIVIFPQGQRSNVLKEVKGGVGFLFKKTKCKIIAARIYGTGEILPRGKKFIHPGRIRVIFEEVKDISPEQSRLLIAKKVLEKIKNLVGNVK